MKPRVRDGILLLIGLLKFAITQAETALKGDDPKYAQLLRFISNNYDEGGS